MKAITFSFGREATDDDDATSQILPGPLPTDTRNFPSGLHQTTKGTESKSQFWVIRCSLS